MIIVLSTVISAAILALLVGLVTSLAAALSGRMRKKGSQRSSDGTLRVASSSVLIYWTLAAWSVGIGFFEILAPISFYGPSWSYFAAELPGNGYWMGCICVTLGLLQGIVLWRNWSSWRSLLSALLFLTGFVFWTAGTIIAAEGLLGHMGLMEAPFMMYSGVHAFAHSADLSAKVRREKSIRHSHEAHDGE